MINKNMIQARHQAKCSRAWMHCAIGIANHLVRNEAATEDDLMRFRSAMENSRNLAEKALKNIDGMNKVHTTNA